MLSQMFPRSSAKYAQSPLAQELSGFFDWLVYTGYSKDNIRGHLRRTYQVLGRLEAARAGAARERVTIHRAFGRRCTSVERSQHFHGTERAYCRFLRDKSWLIEEASPRDPVSLLLRRYERYLKEVRGFAASTIEHHLVTVSEFLKVALRSGRAIRTLSGAHIERYLAQKRKCRTRQAMQHVVAHLRAFLRYGSAKGVVRKGLENIDTVRTYRDELPPRALPWQLVEQLLSSVDRKSKAGWRDYAVLHLMAHYGLRPSEIAALRIDSIDWHAKTCHVKQRKTHSDLVLPLSKQTLKLLQRYLRQGRPESALPYLFLRVRRPAGGLRHYGVCEIFYKRAALSGLGLEEYSSYCLRHGFAMRLFARGVGVKAIGDLLGHRSLEATCVYLRLDISALRNVALSVPCGPQRRRRPHG